jgi:outer membrane immunogenic protein
MLELKMTMLALASSALIGSAHAADMIERIDPVPVPVEAAQPFNWAGAYLGGHIGYGRSSLHFHDLNLCLEDDPGFHNGVMKLKDDGFLGGVQAGYNWTSGNYLFGLEGDLSWTNIGQSRFIQATVPQWDVSFNMDFHGTARTRAGVVLDRALIYATGGLAFAKMNYSFKARTGPDNYTNNDIKIGWAAGAGVEVAVSERVSLKLEYMHSEFSGTSDFTTVTMGSNKFRFDDHKVDTVKIGFNFHL